MGNPDRAGDSPASDGLDAAGQPESFPSASGGGPERGVSPEELLEQGRIPEFLGVMRPTIQQELAEKEARLLTVQRFLADPENRAVARDEGRLEDLQGTESYLAEGVGGLRLALDKLDQAEAALPDDKPDQNPGSHQVD